MKKKMMYLGVFAVLFASALGMTAFAATSGKLSCMEFDAGGIAALQNTSGSERYCSVYMYKSAYNDGSNLVQVAAGRGSVKNNAWIQANKKVSAPYLYANGMVYKGKKASSGVGATYHKRIK